MTTFTPPPTYAEPVIADEKTGKSTFNPIWLKWFLDISAFVSINGGSSSGGINHESLQGLLGGAAGDHQHFTSAEHGALTAGFSGTGNLVRTTGASFTDTPSVGNAAAAIKSSVAFNNGAGALVGTLTNSPVTGNPTKWLPINDNGVTRYIPAW